MDYTENVLQYRTQINGIETTCAALGSLLPHFENLRGYTWAHTLIIRGTEEARVVIDSF